MSDDSDGFEWVGADDDPADAADSGEEEATEAEGRSTTDENAATDDDEAYEPSIAGVFGARPEDAPRRTEIVPETPELENVLFVLLGVLLGLFVIYRAVVVFGG